MTGKEMTAEDQKTEESDIVEEAKNQLDFSDLEEDRECPFSIEERKRVLEALLFVSDKPTGLSQMVSAFGFDGDEKPIVLNKEIEEALKEYKEDLQQENRGFRLHSVSGGYQLRTSEDMKPFLQNTIKARTFRLTGPTLETLAIVAYKQPITKSQVDDIRGVDSSHLVRGLMDKDLLSFAGKSELPGKPMLYKTTTRFLEIFGLRNLNELPSLSEIEALIPEGIGDEEEKEEQTLSQLTGKLSENAEDSYSVSEEEHDKIAGELSQITTSTEFFEQEKQRERERKELEKAENIREALMVGEEVSSREKRWLERFEEKIKADEEEVGRPEEQTQSDTEPPKETESALDASIALEANVSVDLGTSESEEGFDKDDEASHLEQIEMTSNDESSGADSANDDSEEDDLEPLAPLNLD